MRPPAPILALSLALAALPAAAQQADRPTISRQDRHFVDTAQAGGVAEVQLGKLASQRAENEAVKSFGQRMVVDHSQANQQLSTIVGRLGLPAAGELPRDEQHKVERLNRLNGAEFDRAFMSAMVDDHKKDVDLFRRQAERGTNPELKAFAQQTVPILQQHLTLAQQTQASLHGQQAEAPR